jgi:hypothetical protein
MFGSSSTVRLPQTGSCATPQQSLAPAVVRSECCRVWATGVARARQVAAAAQQFQAKNCTDVEFGLYCATVPTVAASRGLRFSCWMGAYPGLGAHFGAAGLNPGSNHWDKARRRPAAAPGRVRRRAHGLLYVRGGDRKARARFHCVQCRGDQGEAPSSSSERLSCEDCKSA